MLVLVPSKLLSALVSETVRHLFAGGAYLKEEVVIDPNGI